MRLGADFEGVKHLPKHLRPRWRYLAVGIEAWPDADVDRRAFQRALWFAAGNLLGDVGSAALDSSLLHFRFDDSEGDAVVRVRRDAVEQCRAALAAIDEVDGQPVGLRIRGTSGTVRACEEKYIRRPPERSKERTVAFADTERPAVVRGDRIDVVDSDGRVGATALDIRDN
jgi:ribonuclease P/MRP protein subunit POP5|nr:Rpp14/Pop5 family protein [Natronomonas aquatica]